MSDFGLKQVWDTVYWSVPAFLLFQVLVLVWLLWKVGVRWQPRLVGASRWQRWLLYIGAFAAPVVMLFFSAAVGGGYQGERGGHWFYHMHSGLAGLVLLPVFASGSVGTAVFLAKGAHLRSTANFIVLLTLTAICVWYAYATAFLHMGDDKSFDLGISAIVPAIAGANYALLGIDVWRHRMMEAANSLGLYVWFIALGVSLAAKVPLAQRVYEALPKERPAGYGDCFVVSAAALGHSSFVGSRIDPVLGMPVNRQLHTLWSFEKQLALHWPRTHRYLRRTYNRIGPRVARRVRTPIVADIAYVILKPIEWSAACCLTLWNSGLIGPARASPNALCSSKLNRKCYEDEGRREA